MRFYLVDRIRVISPGNYIEGEKLVSMSEDVFNDHFPGLPLFPGSLILESLAQISGLLFEYSMKERGLSERKTVLSMVQRMKYRRMVIPGDCMQLKAKVKMFYPDEYGATVVSAFVEDQLCAEGELLFSFPEIRDEDMKNAIDRLMRLAFKHAEIRT